MATSETRRARPVRTLVTFGILILLLFGTLIAGVQLDPKSEDNPGGASWAPGLALDLEGGTQVILQPVSTDGSRVTEDDINQAIGVIRQRIDSSGVAEAEITSQGGSNIVVGIPGQVSDETIDLVATAAQMRFRPVLDVGFPNALAAEDGEEGAEDAPENGEEAADAEAGAVDEEATEDGTPEDATTDEDATDEAATDDAATDDAATDETPAAEPADPSDVAWITPAVQEEFDALDCTLPENRIGGSSGALDQPLVTCADDGSLKYILGPVEIEGTAISNANSGLRVNEAGITTNEWVVNLEFDSAGSAIFRDTTRRLIAQPEPRNAFAMVLDGLVISAPRVNTVIPNGQAEISGSFTRESAATLANQLNFGALPITFEVQSQEQISATLGSEQLQRGLLAGVIGLGLIVIFFIVQYRVLGLVTVASLVVAGVVTYVVITLLSWSQGYRLSLPGVAGLIVAIGIIADSFILYYERIRDELRDGRTLQSAVDKGWERARRTIIASDAVNLLAAIILYMLAVGGVRGFAFTLGLMTIIDLFVVFFFTHPLTKLLARTKFFGEGHKWSGLDPRSLGVDAPRYVGRGRVVVPGRRPDVPAPVEASPVGDAVVDDAPPQRREAVPVGSRPAPAARADGSRMTIAERRAAERRAKADNPGTDGQDAAGAETEEKL